MSENSKMDAVFAFILGLVIGAAAGVLLAPNSGDKTRKKLGRWLEDTAEKAKDSLENIEKKLDMKKG